MCVTLLIYSFRYVLYFRYKVTNQVSFMRILLPARRKKLFVFSLYSIHDEGAANRHAVTNITLARILEDPYAAVSLISKNDAYLEQLK